MRLKDFVGMVQSRFKLNGGMRYGLLSPVSVLILLSRLSVLIHKCRESGKIGSLESLVSRSRNPGLFDFDGRRWRRILERESFLVEKDAFVLGCKKSALADALIEAADSLSENEMEFLLAAVDEFVSGSAE